MAQYSMRLFIASPVVLYDYTALGHDFASLLEGKWVEEKSLHLTWVFLGECETTEAVREQMQKLRPLESPEALVSLGTFGRPPRILYARSPSAALYEKAREFRRAGFEMQRFTPHATLCRIKKIHDYKAFKNLKEKYRGKILGEIKPEISLYQSTLTEQGSVYKKVISIT